MVNLMDKYAVGYSILVAVFLETLAVSWFYGTCNVRALLVMVLISTMIIMLEAGSSGSCVSTNSGTTTVNCIGYCS